MQLRRLALKSDFLAFSAVLKRLTATLLMGAALSTAALPASAASITTFPSLEHRLALFGQQP